LVTYYRHNFFSPLVILFIIGQILNIFLDLPLFLNVSFINLFGAPINLGSILVIVGGIYFWTIGSSLIEKFITNILLYNLQQDPNIRQVVGLIIRYFLMGLGIVIIFGYVGFSPTALAAITGGLSVGIGFGLKEIISNFVSGIWLLFEGVLKPGDVIIIDGEMSEVKKLGVRATTVQVVRDNSEQIIPNQTFFTQTMTTLTGSDRLSYRSLSVGASYACDPQQVIKVLLQVADHHPRVLKLPPPIAFLVGFGDSSLNFELKFWLDEPLTGKRTISELSCHIWQAFAEAGIEIPFPQQDVHIDYPSSNS
jgi:small-conductance mechanosensitive channel